MCPQKIIEYACQQFNHQVQPGFWENFGNNILASVCATIIFLSIFEFIWKNISSWLRNKKYKGKYLHYDTNRIPCITNGNQHYSEITIKFWKRDTLFIKSHDFAHPCGIWNGEIKIDSSKFMNGMGTYSYADKSTMGNHRIYSVDKNTIFVQVLDYRGIGNPNLWIKEKK
jgi:hypothetical protein